MSDLTYLSVSSLSEGLRKGQFSSVEVTRAYLDAIAARGEGGAYLAVAADMAMAKARETDTKRASGESLHALAGVPMALSDNICVKGVAATCGSRTLEGFIPPYTAHAAEKLIARGAVLLGKLKMSEFGMGPGHEDGGATAVAAHEAAFSLSSDTGGCLRVSAARRGVIGVRPTYGAVSRYGLAAFASSLDQIGVYARDVRDAAMALEAIMGHDPRDATSAARVADDLLSELDEGARGIKIALPKEYLSGELDGGIREGVLTAAKRFESMGASVRETSLPLPEEALRAYYIISSAEASSNLARYDGIKYGARAGCGEGVDEVIETARGWGFGAEVKRRIMLGAFALCSEHYSDYYERALAARRRVREGFERAFQGCDVILAPVSPRGEGEDKRGPMEAGMDEIYTAPASLAGLPALSMPCGADDDGQPMGAQLIGRAHGEAAILRAARAYTWR